MSDYYSIQEVGGDELARHYPDRGQIHDADWHRAIITAGEDASGFRRLFRKVERFIAVLSANGHGLRVFVALDKFAIFIPWSAMSVWSERSTPGTVVRLRTAAVPSLSLEFHLGDAAADAIFGGIMPALPQRDPPGRLFWPKPWATGVLLCVMFIVAATMAMLRLTWATRTIATAGAATGIWLLWHVCLSEER